MTLGLGVGVELWVWKSLGIVARMEFVVRGRCCRLLRGGMRLKVSMCWVDWRDMGFGLGVGCCPLGLVMGSWGRRSPRN